MSKSSCCKNKATCKCNDSLEIRGFFEGREILITWEQLPEGYSFNSVVVRFLEDTIMGVALLDEKIRNALLRDYHPNVIGCAINTNRTLLGYGSYIHYSVTKTDTFLELIQCQE